MMTKQQDAAPEICLHCGLDVPKSSASLFCCRGCETVYEAIVGCGLQAYYDLREESKRPALSALKDFRELDAPTDQDQKSPRTGLQHTELYLEGIHCAACVWLIEKLPTIVDGVTSARLNFASSKLNLEWDASQVALSKIAKTLSELGYPPHDSASTGSAEANRQVQTKSDRVLLVRIGVAGAAFGNVMLASVALYSGAAYGMTEATSQLFRWESLLVALPAITWAALPFYRGAQAAIRTKTPHMDLPIALGIAAATISGVIATVRQHGEIYFDSVTMLVFLLLVGRWLSGKQQREAAKATDLMMALAPSTSRLLEGGDIRSVQSSAVPKGALVELRSGESIGVDGVVTEGCSNLDESLLTGESAARRAGPGDSVHAGTINLSQRLVVRTTTGGKETRLARLVEDLSAAAQHKAPIAELANRISLYFLIVVVSLAAAAFMYWLSEGWEKALEVAISVLIVTCPCALGLATPLLTNVALGQAARAGLLIKGGKFLEQLQRPSLVVFDKTGTLTEGQLSIIGVTGPSPLWALVRAAEAQSSHPIAEALRRALPVCALLQTQDAKETQGAGIEATVDGHLVCIGKSEYVQARLTKRVTLEETEMGLAVIQAGLSPVYIAVDGVLERVLGIGDPVREEAAGVLKHIHQMGHRLAILSGDAAHTVQRVAAALAVPFENVLAAQSPEQKLAFIQRAKRETPVIMVGDGVNDAAALSAADVGVALHGGAETSLAAADVFSTRTGLEPILELLQGSRLALRAIRQNLGFSLLYNIVAAGLAVSGYITPLWAAILMPLSSLSVLANSIRCHIFATPQGNTPAHK